MNRDLVTVVIGAAISTIAVAYIIHRVLRKKRPQHPNGEWVFIGKLKEISLYPLNSGAAVVLKKAVCDKKGLYALDFRDFRFLLMNDNDEVITANIYPVMLSIKPAIVSNNVLQVTSPRISQTLVLDVKKLLKKGRRVDKRQKGTLLRLVECTSRQHEWFSHVILNRPEGLRLYIVLDQIPETICGENNSFRPIPVLAVHDRSVEDLNRRLSDSNKATHRQFRGNLLLESMDNVVPFEEERWMWMKIGDNIIHNVILQFHSNCLHSILININPDTCKRNNNCEPLRTLQTYRALRQPSQPTLGVYFEVYQQGFMRAGDHVYVQYKDDY